MANDQARHQFNTAHGNNPAAFPPSLCGLHDMQASARLLTSDIWELPYIPSTLFGGRARLGFPAAAECTSVPME